MSLTPERIEKIQNVLRQTGCEAWVLYNFRDLNPIACRLLGIDDGVHQTRRWVAVIPASGEPRSLVHAIEPHLARWLPGETGTYSSLEQFARGVREMLEGYHRVAMEYSPGNALPVVARVDAGTVELVRDLGLEVVSSGELIARVESQLRPEQIAAARRAGAACRRVMRSAFTLIAERVGHGQKITEYDVVRHILRELEGEGLATDHEPNCSVGANAANPHYQPTAESSSEITLGDFVLIDLWGSEGGADGVYGDITWTGYLGEEVPEEYATVFSVVRRARDRALEIVVQAFETESPVSGAEVDRAARRVIDEAGYGERFIHRTGHSITHELHGAGTNLDALETIDERPIIPASSFSIEPGIYLPGRFGVRSEIDVVIDPTGEVIVTSSPAQQQVLPLLNDDVMRGEEMGG